MFKSFAIQKELNEKKNELIKLRKEITLSYCNAMESVNDLKKNVI